jgi:hypothetical protein
MIETKNEDLLEEFHDFIGGLIVDCDDKRAILEGLNKKDRDKIEDWLIDIQLIAEDIDAIVEKIMERRKSKEAKA